MIHFLFTWSLLLALAFSFAIPFYVPFPVRPTRRLYTTLNPTEITSMPQVINKIMHMSPTLILPGSEHFESAQSLLRIANASSTLHDHDEKILSQLPGTWYTLFTDIPLREKMPFSEVVSENCTPDSTVNIVGLLQQIGKPNMSTKQGTFNTSILFKLTGCQDIFTQSIEGTYTVPEEHNEKKKLELNFISSHLTTWDPDNREAKLHKLVHMTELKPSSTGQTLITPAQDPGWMTMTYLSEDGDFRIARNNRNYTFVMKKIMLAEEEEGGLADNSDDLVKQIIHSEVDSNKPAESPEDT